MPTGNLSSGTQGKSALNHANASKLGDYRVSFLTTEFCFQAVDKAKAIIEADANRSFVVDVFDAGSNQKVRNKYYMCMPRKCFVTGSDKKLFSL